MSTRKDRYIVTREDVLRQAARRAAENYEKALQRVVDFFLSKGDFPLIKEKLPGAAEWMEKNSKELKDSDYLDISEYIDHIYNIVKDAPTDPDERSSYRDRVFLSEDGGIFVKLLAIESEKDTGYFFDALLPLLRQKRSRRESIVNNSPFIYNKKANKEKSWSIRSTYLNTLKGKLPRGAKEVEDVIGSGEFVPMKLGEKGRNLYEIGIRGFINVDYSGRPIDAFDILVIDAIFSLWKRGISRFTEEQVYNEMHFRDSDSPVPFKEVERIRASINKLLSIGYDPLPADEKTIKDFLKSKKISEDKLYTMLGSMILKLEWMWGKTNSGWRKVWVFSPRQTFFENGEVMKQITQYSSLMKKPLYIDRGGVSEDIIKMTGKRPEIKSELLRHIINIAGDALDNDIIDMENLYIWSGIDLENRREKAHAAEFVLQCLDYWSHPDNQKDTGIADYKPNYIKLGRYKTLKSIEIIKVQTKKSRKKNSKKANKKEASQKQEVIDASKL